MMQLPWFNQISVRIRQFVSPYQTVYGFETVHVIWVVSLSALFISILQQGVAWLTAADVALVYGLLLGLLWFGLQSGILRWFVWAVVLTAWFGLVMKDGESVWRYFLAPDAAAIWMALTILGACAMLLYRTARQEAAESLLLVGLFFVVMGFLSRWHLSWAGGVETAQIPLVAKRDILLLILGVMLGLTIYLVQRRVHHLVVIPVLLLAGFHLLWLPDTAGLPPLAQPVLQHVWLKLHVPAMVIALAVLFMAGVTGVVSLFQAESPAHETKSGDGGLHYHDAMNRLLSLGVVLLSIGLLTGMWWADLAWGDYLLPEPKLAGALALWFYYLGALHQRLQKGAGGQAQIWWLIGGLPLLVFVLFGIDVLFVGRHLFI
ncbi:MAG: cytochrome c biogenesis protein [Gammaproteobacteria bacterium]|nr:cytochrome c biogenesis protein [Gammaproteobacteria bacterium]MDH5650481.1 cytochrome c biogenesis protein [Gammaproteobacteria bacterium]